jgi:plasmid stabilization system protein ParE
VKVHWTQTAVGHLESIRDYIARSSPDYADRIVDRLLSRSVQIEDFPMSGRKVPEADLDQIRELIEGPYRIVYYLLPDRIDILAVIHGAQRTPWSA